MQGIERVLANRAQLEDTFQQLVVQFLLSEYEKQSRVDVGLSCVIPAEIIQHAVFPELRDPHPWLRSAEKMTQLCRELQRQFNVDVSFDIDFGVRIDYPVVLVQEPGTE